MAITPFKVTNFGTNRKIIYDFLLVINTNFSASESSNFMALYKSVFNINI